MSQALIMQFILSILEKTKWSCLLAVCLFAQPVNSADSGNSAFLDDELEDRIAEVNEGGLSFITGNPDKPVHRHYNRIFISENSLRDGWVTLRQCHDNLDPVPAIDIRFNSEKIRNIQILSKDRISSANVNGHIVELVDAKPAARLCLQADSQALHRMNSGSFQLRNGPFMRQFLDGFYPMQVTMEVSWPSEIFRLVSYKPDPGSAGHVKTDTGRVTWNALFEGRLFTEFTFQQR